MTFRLDDDQAAFCYLKYSLEPEYTVVSEPSADYFAEWQYHYKVLQQASVVAEFQGDFRTTPTGQLQEQVLATVTRLNGLAESTTGHQNQPDA